MNLVHTGVLGMHWGVHRTGNHSSDHKQFTSSRRKKLKDMTDDELKTVMKRMQLINEYKAARPPKPPRGEKKISEMSNAELENAIRTRKLVREDWFVGVRKMKQISKMNEEEVKKTLDRHMLEKSYKELDKGKVEVSRKIVKYLMYGDTP